ncbi:hypothetical protein [Bifidobacterium callitrichos]|uniref:hypothetical protein n=1 Tax=Bifidobacterium callitrichos TaxID=762209 RepID=UPI001CC315B9|nr:hypothetical protein [Bifidobacterium callitrichos]
MATKRQVALRFRDEYMKASKKDKGRILDEMCSVLKIGRSTTRRTPRPAGSRADCRKAGDAEAVSFLRKIDAEVPDGLDVHVVCDNYGTHNVCVQLKVGRMDVWTVSK